MDHQTATAPVPQRLPAEYEGTCSAAVAVLTAYINARGLRPVCSCAWLCGRVVLTERDLAAL